MSAPLAGLDSVDLSRLVQQARDLVDPPADSAVLLEGSLAEGFGNEASDIDLVFLSEDPGPHPTMPTNVFLQDRRVEIRVRTVAEGFRQLEQVSASAARGRKSLSRVSRDLIDRVQRIGHALPLVTTEHSARLQTACASPAVTQVIRDWFRGSADDALLTADALRVLGDAAAARSWCRTAGIRTVKAWLAERGDTYIETKWHGEQLQRTPHGAGLLAELADLLAAGSNTHELVTAIGAFQARHLAGPWVRLDGQAVLRPNRRVTTWRIGHNLHILGPDRSVYVLGDTAARIWGELRFGVDLTDMVSHLRAVAGDQAGRVLAEFHHLGLVLLATRRRGILSTRPTSLTLPLEGVVHIGVDGADWDGLDPTEIRPLPISAATFAEAGMSLVWNNLVVENTLEDINGALKKEQWVMLGVATRRCVQYLCMTALAARGVVPGPAEEEAVTRTGRLGVIPEDLWVVAESLENRTQAQDPTEAAAIVDDLRHLVTAVRSHLPRGDALPLSFSGDGAWADTLAFGGDWIRLATYLGVRPPKEEAQDLMGSERSTTGSR